MKFSTMRELKLETTKVFRELLKEGTILITKRGKPVAILERFTENDFAKQFDELRSKSRAAAETAGVGPEDIEKIIREVRKV